MNTDATAAEHLDEASQALEDLMAQLADEHPLAGVLNQLAESAVRVIPDTTAVSVTLVEGEGGRTAAATEQLVADVDEVQYRAGVGPCLEAAHSLKPVRVSVAEARDRWPDFADAAERAGARAYLSAPLMVDVDGHRLLGALNLYSEDEHGFDPFDEALLRLFTTAASTAITGARRYERSRALIANLQRALLSRAEIDQAKGVLMAAHGIGPDEAFRKLAEESQRQNTKLRDVAKNLLESVRTEG
ncbi:ANTAR domain-containing response regulator [Actinosynnema mirum]|uniref:ANTAR domain-containing protein n=2 Tax=Actinosynnema TaxID=40566 RepID=C6WH29_ACTMD|nr:GAF and ANTAR domain-containing protein [Actinosynnema mirum]ACU36097.1 ANTAR domain protein with unknown sensor [Actinosynnema mirum DSM 43827]AXX29550.1 transcriptional regulator, MerR family [Actinosynnema pretiosum subsp. pretiosum]